jgi:hypothetical protein
MSCRNKNEIYDIVFALIEEELHQRRNPSGYTDIVLPFDGSKFAVGQTSNFDINILEREKRFRSMIGGNHMDSNVDLKQISDKNYIPGKFDAIKYSYHLPLDIALKGTIARQQLFFEEQNRK